MRRKLIKQGGSGLTVYVPKKWLDENNLHAGDEVEINSEGNNLLFSPTQVKQKPKEIELNIEDDSENTVRITLGNLYRKGYDKIILNSNCNLKLLNEVVSDYFIGFEVFEKEKGPYVIEEVAEPNYDNFENILQKHFFLLHEIINSIGLELIFSHVVRIQKYNNFLKRSLSKRIITFDNVPFLWQFLSNLNLISRECYHLTNYLVKEKKPLSKKNKQTIEILKQMLLLLHKGYLRKDSKPLFDILKKEKEIGREKYALLLKEDSLINHYLINILRLIYLSASPLMGLNLSYNNLSS